MMTTIIRTIHTVGIMTTVLFGIGLLTMTNILPFASASPATTGGGDQAGAKMHLDEAMKALQAGDTAGAKMHAQAAQDNL
jgi:hypothetical protein